MSKFQIIIIAVFGFFIIVGIAVFALSKGGGSNDRGQTIIWGTVSKSIIEETLKEVRLSEDEKVDISYIEKTPATFETDFVEALAVGRGPDAVIIPHELLYQEREKLYPLSYDYFSERAFKDTFVESAEIFLSPEGTLGLPLAVDPLVLYWNRSLFSSAALAKPPAFWEEFFALVPKLSLKDETIVRQSLAPLGEFRNILHAKDILATLFMQAGTPIVSDKNGQPKSVLAERFNSAVPPAESSLRFYTEFANPLKPTYTWNRSLPDSKTFFLSGDSALYFGRASEFRELRDKNPNLNFDVTLMPQAKEARGKSVFGTVYAVSIVRGVKDLNNTLANIGSLWGKIGATKFSEASGLPPVRRDLLSVRPNNPYESVFYNSALISSVWLDPSPDETKEIFKDLVESVTSGRLRLPEAINRANLELEALF